MTLPRQEKGKPILATTLNAWPEAIERYAPPAIIPRQDDKGSDGTASKLGSIEVEVDFTTKNYLVPIYDPGDLETEIGTMTIAYYLAKTFRNSRGELRTEFYLPPAGLTEAS